MTVKEYSKKADDLIKTLEGKVPGLLVTSGIGISVTNLNNNPAILFCEVDAQKNPTKILYCLILDNMQVVRRLELWLEESLNIFKMKNLMESDVDKLVAASENVESKTE